MSHEILCIEPIEAIDQNEFIVWENLILIEAHSPEEAYIKAIERGIANESEISIGEKKGTIKFKGLKDLVLIYDDLEDGAEIEWREMKLSKKEIELLLKKKEDFHAFNPTNFDKDSLE